MQDAAPALAAEPEPVHEHERMETLKRPQRTVSTTSLRVLRSARLRVGAATGGRQPAGFEAKQAHVWRAFGHAAEIQVRAQHVERV